MKEGISTRLKAINLLVDNEIHKEVHAQTKVVNQSEIMMDSFGMDGIKNVKSVIAK